MTKKILSLVLAVVMVLTMIPAMAFAAEPTYDLTLSGVKQGNSAKEFNLYNGEVKDENKLGTVVSSDDLTNDESAQTAKLTGQVKTKTVTLTFDLTNKDQHDLEVYVNGSKQTLTKVNEKTGSITVTLDANKEVTYAINTKTADTDGSMTFAATANYKIKDDITTSARSEATIVSTGSTAVEYGKLAFYKKGVSSSDLTSVSLATGEKGNVELTSGTIKVKMKIPAALPSESYRVIYKPAAGYMNSANSWNYDSATGYYYQDVTVEGAKTISDLTIGEKTKNQIKINDVDGTTYDSGYVKVTKSATPTGGSSTNYSVKYFVNKKGVSTFIPGGVFNETANTWTVSDIKADTYEVTVDATGCKAFDGVLLNSQKQNLVKLNVAGKDMYKFEFTSTTSTNAFVIDTAIDPNKDNSNIIYDLPGVIKVGQTFTMSPSVKNLNGRIVKYTYSSTDKSILTVTANGVVTPHKTSTAGELVIKANISAGGGYPAETLTRTYSNINVDKGDQQIWNVSSTNLVTVGKYINLYPKATDSKDFAYTSNNPSITVDGNGKVFAKGAGTAKITIVAKATPNYNAAVKEISVSTSNMYISGSVEIRSFVARPGFTAYADTSKVGPSGAYYDYEWTLSGSSTVASRSSYYTIKNEDIGKTLYLTIRGRDGYSGSVSTSVYLDNGKPNIINQPSSVKYNIGDTARALTVTAKSTGSTTFTYQWYKDGKVIVGATSASYTPSTKERGKAEYYCKVKNTYGEVTSSVATVQNLIKVGDFSMKAKKYRTTIKLMWYKAENAEKYRVYERVNGKYKAIKTVNNRSLWVKVKPGSKHVYKIKAINGGCYSWSPAKKFTAYK